MISPIVKVLKTDHSDDRELEKFNRIMVGRENKMLELKQEINDLCTKMKLPPRYASPSNAVKM